LLTFKKYAVVIPLVRVFFRKIIEHIDREIFNTIISRHEFCCCGVGFHVKLQIAEVQHWFDEKQYFGNLGDALDHSKECASVLLLDKALLLEEDAREEMCPHLNIQQLKILVLSFVPDDFFKKKISPNVIKEINRIAKIESANVPLLLDDSEVSIDIGAIDTDTPITNQLEWINQSELL